jgi:5-oxoprolinase (ATP-hydrolysing)
LTQLTIRYGKEVVQHYMGAIRNNAEIAVRELLRTRVKESPLIAEEYMDDGAVISLRVDIADDGSATFDFTGTSLETYSNLNIPPAVVRSAIMYCLRVLVAADIPMNAGVLEAINVVIPPGTMLRPSDDAAVSSGNTETSQRCVDVIFKAFHTLAGSQGTMNYTALDYKEWCYAETICGGAGAGPGWHGQAATHVHVGTADHAVADHDHRCRTPEFATLRSRRSDSRFSSGNSRSEEVREGLANTREVTE